MNAPRWVPHFFCISLKDFPRRRLTTYMKAFFNQETSPSACRRNQNEEQTQKEQL
jgi:hypothetical protein